MSAGSDPETSLPTPQPRRSRKNLWLYIAGAGSAVWVSLMVVLAVYGSRPALEQPGAPAPALEPIAAGTSASVPPPTKPAGAESSAKPALVESLKLPKRDTQVAREAKSSPELKTEPELVKVEEAKPQAAKRIKSQQPAPKDLDLAVFANCKEIGTNVLFVKNPPDAFKRAKAENKMVFMVHLSGNLEDPGFT